MLMKAAPLYLLQDSDNPQARICGRCEVRRSALFGALDASSLERIHGAIESPTVPPGTVIYPQGRHGAHVHTLRSGIVRFERYTEGGDRRIVRLAGRGDLIGQEALLGRPYAEEAVACTEVQLCRIPCTLVNQLGETEARLLRELMQRWQHALERAEDWVTDLTTGLARRRMLKLMAQIDAYADDDGRIWLPRRDEMGAMLDITLETASRIVSQLRRDGVLTLDAPGHARLDRERLQHALRALDDA